MAALNVRTCVEGSKMNITWDLEGGDIQAVCITTLLGELETAHAAADLQEIQRFHKHL